jgi:hypothetical protein
MRVYPGGSKHFNEKTGTRFPSRGRKAMKGQIMTPTLGCVPIRKRREIHISRLQAIQTQVRPKSRSGRR